MAKVKQVNIRFAKRDLILLMSLMKGFLYRLEAVGVPKDYPTRGDDDLLLSRLEDAYKRFRTQESGGIKKTKKGLGDSPPTP